MANDKPLGKVMHYYDKAMVVVVKLEGALKAGDMIKFMRGEKEFTQKVESMQVEHEAIKSAKKGDEVAIKVEQPAKEGALVFKAE